MRSYFMGVDATKKIGTGKQNKQHGTALERRRVVHRRWHLSVSVTVQLSGDVKITSRQPPAHLSYAFQGNCAARTPCYA